MQREGPRLEVVKHREAEARVRASILRREMGQPWDYEGRDEDIAIIKRKTRELGHERLKRFVGGGA